MKKKILSSLCAVAVMAYASLSWGVGVNVENYSENFLMTDASAFGLTLGTTTSAVNDTTTVNGVTVVQPVQAGPGAMSGLGTVTTATTLIQGNSIVAESSVAMSPAAASPDVYALAAGNVTIVPWGNANPLLPDHARLLSAATFHQNFTATAAGTLILQGDFRHFWQGDASSFKGLWSNTFTILDSTGTAIAADYSLNGGALVNTGLFTAGGAYLPGENGNNGLFSNLVAVVALPGAGIYSWESTAGIDAADPVPEPSTFVLAGSGLLGLFLMRRRAVKKG